MAGTTIRRFHGKLYRFHSRHAILKWARDEARAQRDKGKSARIVKYAKKQYPFEVFIRP